MELSNQSNLPKLQGASNYPEWRFRIRIAERQITHGQNKKKMPDDIELKVQSVIVNSLSDKILSHIIHCNSGAEMLEKLESMYGPKEEDLDALQTDFMNFRYDNSQTMQENTSRLESLRQKIINLGDNISDAAFRTRLLSVLPKRFGPFVSATNLNKKIKLSELLTALTSEDARLQKMFDDKQKKEAKRPTAAMLCFKCEKPGHRAFECKSAPRKNNPSTSNYKPKEEKPAEKGEDFVCKYCKEKGHIVKNCPELEKKNNAICRICQEKGHYAKNCTKGKDSANSLLSCYKACLSVSHVLVNSSVDLDKNAWYLDNACTSHVCNNEAFLTNIEEINGSLIIGTDFKVNIDKRGTVLANCGGQNGIKLALNETIFNPKMPANLVSFVSLLKNGWKVEKYTLNEIVLEKEDSRIVATLEENGLWSLPIIPVISNSVVLLSLTEWHKKFAHQNLQYVKEMLDRLNIKYGKPVEEKCVSCLEGKAIVLPYSSSEFKTTKVGELVHADVLTSPTLSLGGSKYALVIKDDYSCFRVVYFLKKKSDAVDGFKDFFNMFHTQTGNKVKTLRTDNGTELINEEINELRSELGFIHQTSCPFSSQQNGKAEREIRTLSEATTTILIESKSPKNMWAEAMAYVVFTINRTSKSKVPGKTPYEVFYNRSPFDVKRLEPFGKTCVVQIPKATRKKFDPKGIEGVFIGYPNDTKGYKVKTKDRTLISRNVIFYNEPLNAENIEQECNDSVDNVMNSDEADNDNETEIIEVNLDCDWSDGEEEEIAVKALLCYTAPKSFDEIRSMDKESKRIWEDAVQNELESMQKHEVWEEVPFDGQKLIDTTWVFRAKATSTGVIGKARLVAKGYQVDECGDTYAPVVSITSVRVFLSVAVHRGMVIKQFDVETAFLNSPLEEEIYIKVPKGYCGKSKVRFVLRLLKALYGLKQAPANWFKLLKEILLKLGFKQCSVELCMFISRDSSIILVIYVDDGLIAGDTLELIEEFLTQLRKYFNLRVFDKIENFIGLHLKVEVDSIQIDQCNYVNILAQKYGVENCKIEKTPMEPKLNLNIGNSKTKDLCVTKFQQLLGALNYVMERTRPDVNFALNLLSQHQLRANGELYKYLLRVLKYLKSCERKVIFKVIEEAPPIESFCDASWASDPDRKSCTGYVIRVFGNLIDYKTRKQSIVALSTAEAEYIALADCIRNTMWIRNLLIEMNVSVKNALVRGDNQASLQIAESKGNYNRTKHIDIKYQYVRDLVTKKLIRLHFVESKDNLADMLTKSVPEAKIRNTMCCLGFT